MWVIIGSDGDVDYTNVYGPFTTEAEADAKCDLLPPDNGDIAYRVEPIQPVTTLDSILAEQDSEDEVNYENEEFVGPVPSSTPQEYNIENEDFVVPLPFGAPQEYNTENADFIVPLPVSKEYLESEQAVEDRLIFGDEIVNMLGMALGAIGEASNAQEQREAANRAIDLMMDSEDIDEDNLNAGEK